MVFGYLAVDRGDVHVAVSATEDRLPQTHAGGVGQTPAALAHSGLSQETQQQRETFDDEHPGASGNVPLRSARSVYRGGGGEGNGNLVSHPSGAGQRQRRESLAAGHERIIIEEREGSLRGI